MADQVRDRLGRVCHPKRESRMPILFNTLLEAAGLPLAEVRLLRHQDKRAEKGRTPYELWRDNRPQFDLYQSTQSIDNESRLRAKYWASFLGTPAGETL